MFGILLKYIAKEQPGAKVAFSTAIPNLEGPHTFCSGNVQTVEAGSCRGGGGTGGRGGRYFQVLDLKRKNPDFVIFQGFVVILYRR